jgi:hypothetical protein
MPLAAAWPVHAAYLNSCTHYVIHAGSRYSAKYVMEGVVSEGHANAVVAAHDDGNNIKVGGDPRVTEHHSWLT